MITRTKDVRGDDKFDSRDVISRLEELDGYRDEALALVPDEVDVMQARLDAVAANQPAPKENSVDIWTAEDGTEYAVTSDWDEETEREWRQLKELESDAGSREWSHGLGFIRDSYFETYAREFAEDIGAMANCDQWPATCIDWEQAALELQADYSSVELDGTTYWYRD